MYYRRKLLLSLLEAIDSPVPDIAFHAYLLTLSKQQASPSFDFTPCHSGGYSFQATADKRTLTKYGFLQQSEAWALSDRTDLFSELSEDDQSAVMATSEFAKQHRGDDLLRAVYLRYPYYALNSERLNQLLSAQERDRVVYSRPAAKAARLFTIGYEGSSLEAYLNHLFDQRIGLLLDVRKNPVSMKFGFSKNQLTSALDGLDIAYRHMPELGITSDKRKTLESRADYLVLFTEYRATTLRGHEAELAEIQQLIKTYQRVALTCFESDHEYCHRGQIAEALALKPTFKHRIIHL